MNVLLVDDQKAIVDSLKKEYAGRIFRWNRFIQPAAQKKQNWY